MIALNPHIFISIITIYLMLKQGSAMPTHLHNMVVTQESDISTVIPQKTYSSTPSLVEVQTVYGVPTTHIPKPTTLFTIIKSVTENILTTPQEVSFTHSRGIGAIKNISEHETDNEKRTEKDILNWSIVSTTDSDIYTSDPLLDETYPTQTLNNDYTHENLTESPNGNEIATVQYTTEIENEDAAEVDVITSTVRDVATENPELLISGTIMNSDEKDDSNISGNRFTLGRKDRKTTTRASRSLRNLIIPNIIGLSENVTLENSQQSTRTTPEFAENYTLDENRLNGTILMAKNLKLCTRSIYRFLNQTNSTTITEFALLSDNPTISQSSIDSVRLCQSTMVINATLRVVNNTLYLYEPMLQQYIGERRYQVIKIYNSLRKDVQKLVNPSSNGPVMKPIRGYYVQDTSRTLETLATLNRLSGQITDVLQEIGQCYRRWNNNV